MTRREKTEETVMEISCSTETGKFYNPYCICEEHYNLDGADHNFFPTNDKKKEEKYCAYKYKCICGGEHCGEDSKRRTNPSR